MTAAKRHIRSTGAFFGETVERLFHWAIGSILRVLLSLLTGNFLTVSEKISSNMPIFFKDAGQRRKILTGVRRVVIKVGTRLITGVEGVSKADRISQLISAVDGLRKQGLDIIVVTSGAIGAGIVVLGTPKRPQSLSQLQAHAAVGQCQLMYLYEKACVEHGFHCAQMLLTADDVQNRERHLNIRSCLDALLSNGVLPVINENDSVSVDEIRFGDNDVLAALVGTIAKADLTILLTNVDGLKEHADGQLGRRYSVVESLDQQTRSMAKDTPDTTFSVGGMATKLKAAETVTLAGEHMWIADGRDFSVLRGILGGGDIGTLFPALTDDRMRGQKRYLAFFSEPAGDIIVDAGAEQALKGGGRSLLPSGISRVEGDFHRGDAVQIKSMENDRVIAKGLSNYDAEDIRAIQGRNTSEISDILGREGCDPVVHRNYMVLVKR